MRLSVHILTDDRCGFGRKFLPSEAFWSIFFITALDFHGGHDESPLPTGGRRLKGQAPHLQNPINKVLLFISEQKHHSGCRGWSDSYFEWSKWKLGVMRFKRAIKINNPLNSHKDITCYKNVIKRGASKSWPIWVNLLQLLCKPASLIADVVPIPLTLWSSPCTSLTLSVRLVHADHSTPENTPPTPFSSVLRCANRFLGWFYTKIGGALFFWGVIPHKATSLWSLPVEKSCPAHKCPTRPENVSQSKR